MTAVEETPVRIPHHIREDAFFSAQSNRAILNGNPNREPFRIAVKGAWDGRPFWTTVAMAALTIWLLFSQSIFWIVTAVTGFVATAGLAVSASRQKRQQLMRRFDKEGYVVPGKMIQCIASTDFDQVWFGNSRPTFYVTFEVRFRTTEGYRVEAVWKEARNDLNGKPLPMPATPCIYSISMKMSVTFYSDDA